MRDELTAIVRKMTAFSEVLGQQGDTESAQAMALDADALMKLLTEHERMAQQLINEKDKRREAEQLLEKAALAGVNYQGKTGAMSTDIETLQARVAELQQLVEDKDLEDATAVNTRVQELNEHIAELETALSQSRVRESGLTHQLRKARQSVEHRDDVENGLSREADSAFAMLHELIELIVTQPNLGFDTQQAVDRFLKKYELEVETT